MANTIRPTTISFKDWAKDSRTATKMFMCSLVIFLMYLLTGTQTKRVDDCKEEILYLRKRDSVYQREITELKQQQIYFNNVREQETIEYVDSLLHDRTARQVKR